MKARGRVHGRSLYPKLRLTRFALGAGTAAALGNILAVFNCYRIAIA